MQAAPASPTQQGAAPRIGEWISEAFSLFGQQWQVWVVQGIILFAAMMAVIVIGYIVMIVAMAGTMAALFASSPSTGSSSSSGPPPGLFIAIWAGMYFGIFLLVLLTYAVSAGLLAGMEKTAAKQLRGEPISVGDIFSGRDLYFRFLGAMLLSYLAIMLGTMACYLPGLLASGLFAFVQPIVVVERLGAVDSMRRSWEITKRHMWMYLVWRLLLGIIGGLFMPVTYPIFVLGGMIAYRDVVGLPGSLPPLAQRQAIPAPRRAPGQPGYPPGTAPGAYGPGGAPMAAAVCPQCRRPVAAGAVVCPSCQARLTPG